MTEIKPTQVGANVSERKLKGLRMQFAIQMKYMVFDGCDVATDIWAVGTIFTMKEATILIAVCYVFAMVTGLIYTAFMYTKRVKYMFEIKRE